MGKLIIFSAPSGSGKTTIVQSLMNKIPELAFSVSATTRNPRGNELYGIDYYFMTIDEFRAKVNLGEFAEWEEVYEGRLYGTLKSEIERLWAEGKHVVFDVDVKGGIRLKELYGQTALSVFIQAPSVDELKQRLISRNTDDMSEIQKRIEKAAYEMSFAPEFDVVIVNDILEVAIESAFQKVQAFLSI